MPFRIELADGFMFLPDTIGFHVVKNGITIMFENERFKSISSENIYPIGIIAERTLQELKNIEKVLNA